MNKTFQAVFFVIFVSGLMILFARLGGGRTWFSDDLHFQVVGLVGICIFLVSIGFQLADLIMGKKE